MSKHTPGPWVEATAPHRVYTKIGRKNYTVCEIGGGFAPSSAVANARLIAAAPDMLAALKLALAIDPGFPNTPAGRDIRDNVFPVIRAAIAKAEGTS